VVGVAGRSRVEQELDGILRNQRLDIYFQPVVELASGRPFGCEALVRGPEGSPLQTAQELLDAAYRADRVIEFDWLARGLACRKAVEGAVPPGAALLVNAEPLALDSPCPSNLLAPVEQAYENYQVIFEVTERSLVREPRTLLDGLDRVRGDVAGVALDDVGGEPATRCMLPLVQPSIIKLDSSITQEGVTGQLAALADLVREEAERTGALILAEGIETGEDLRRARSFGAAAGQGHLFGAAEPYLEGECVPPDLLPQAPAIIPTVAHPSDLLAGGIVGRGDGRTLAALTEYLAQRLRPVPDGLLLVDLPDAEAYGRLAPTLSDLARAGLNVGALRPDPGDGIRGGTPVEGDGMEWSAVVLGGGYAAAVIGRASAGGGYDFTVTHDRDRVTAVARCLYRCLDRP
jgi:EAL domain-containing protein (putative c-di-GMP-specific phosphodiesterase class I)